jgi:hypothetical protein
MNKDIPLIKFETEVVMGVTVVKNESVITNTLPLGFINMSTWIENRNYAKHKEHLKKWLSEWKIDTTDGFLQITHCLGLNDTFWVKPFESDLVWEQVSLYSNEFTDVACKTAFEKGLQGLQLSTTTPEFTTDGSFPKCWIKDDKGIHILKQGLSGAVNLGKEPYSEYISSNICAQIFKDVVPYNLVMYKDKLCSVCNLFTSEQVGYVPFGRVVDTSKVYTIPGLVNYFKNYDSVHHTDFENSFRRIILMDSIVFNSDRHLFNFGFLFDTDSMELLNIAPAFDFNYSFLTTLTDDDLMNYKESLIKYDLGHKLGGDFDVVGREILTPELKDMLPGHIDIPHHEKYNMSENRMKLLEKIFNENYDVIRSLNVYIRYQRR